MPSTFFGLNTAYLGLSASNASLNTTANNISNVETDGYSRQHTVQSAAECLRVFTSYGCVGAGVDVLAIERYRDEFYDIKYWNNQSNYGQFQAKEYYMKQIENYFRDDDDTMKGFSTIYDEVYTALAELKKDSGTSDVRRDFMGSAEKLTDYFNTQYGNLQNMQKDVNSEIKVYADRINSMAAEIVTLNKQINVIEVAGGNANELRDKRALVIDELSEIVDVRVEDQDVIDTRDPYRDTRCSRFIVKIAGGQTLVDDQVSYKLNCVARQDYAKVNQSDADGLYDLWWSSNDNAGKEGDFINRFALNNASMTGKLKGLFDMRDGNNAEYFHGQCISIDKRTIDDTNEKYSFVTIAAENDYLKDITKSTLPPQGMITVGSKELYYDSWTMKLTESGDCTYEFRISNDRSKNENTNVGGLVGKDSKVGISVNYQGIPYYMEQMNEWVRNFARSFNDILTQENAGRDSIDHYGNPAERMFLYNVAGDSLEQGDFREFYFENRNSKDTVITSEMSSYYLLTAANFAVSDKMMKDPNLMATHTGNVDEVSKYNVVDELIDLKTNTDVMKFRGSSSASFLQAILSDVALNGQKAQQQSKRHEDIGKSIDHQRMSISGVDNDEEALNLVKYQNAYNLSSKMIQVLSEVYDRLILQTGV